MPQSTTKKTYHESITPLTDPDGPDGVTTQLLTDLITASPIPGLTAQAQLSLAQARVDRRAAHKACARKKKKCDDLCEQNGVKFLPETLSLLAKFTSFFKLFSQ